MLFEMLAAGANAAPQNKFGFVEALQTGGGDAEQPMSVGPMVKLYEHGF